MNGISAITLLIVDDEVEIRSGLRSIIPWENYSISVIGTAANGAEALDQIRYYEPDIVITDIQMPGMSGLELVHRAREEQFDTSFVILSGYDDFEYAKTAIRYGVSDYLLKPISIRELTDLVIKLKTDILARRDIHTDQLSTLRKLRTAQISLRKHNLVPQLLRSELNAEEVHQVIREYSLPIEDKESCAVLISVYSARQDTAEYAQLSQYLLPLKESLDQELSQSPVLIVEQPPTGLLMIFNTPFSTGGHDSLKTFLSHHIQRLPLSETVKISAAIGKTVPSLLEIPSSYQSARQIITWHIYPDTGAVMDSSVLDLPDPPVVMPDQDIMEAILRDDKDSIMKRFSLYLDQLLYVPAPPPSYLYSMCNYLIITLQNQLAGYLDGPPQSFTGNSYAVLQNLVSIEEIRNWMYEILCGFGTELSVKKATRADPLIEKAIAYINRNILNNPRTEDVCSYLGLSKSYFSTYFKNKTQLNFRDYTLNLKINYAQDQLKHADHTPSEAALLLGYEDYSSFSRAFKARTGLTPSDYQKQYNS